MQNFFSNLTPGGGGDGGGGGGSDVPWYMKYAAKAAGIGGGIGKSHYFKFWPLFGRAGSS